MQTLTYGMQIPETGDIGSDFFPALEDNFTQLDAHSHNGTDSPKLSGSSMNAYTQNISSASWVAVAGVSGLYKQVVTMSGGLQYDNYIPTFKESVTKDVLLLTVEKETANTYTVYCNDNTLDLVAYYLN